MNADSCLTLLLVSKNMLRPYCLSIMDLLYHTFWHNTNTIFEQVSRVEKLNGVKQTKKSFKEKKDETRKTSNKCNIDYLFL